MLSLTRHSCLISQWQTNTTMLSLMPCLLPISCLSLVPCLLPVLLPVSCPVSHPVSLTHLSHALQFSTVTCGYTLDGLYPGVFYPRPTSLPGPTVRVGGYTCTLGTGFAM